MIQGGKLFGVTHDASTGSAIERQVRALKVGIGVPAGPDCHIWLDAKNNWAVAVGSYGEDKKRTEKIERFPREKTVEAFAFYRESREKAPQRTYPRKLPYFTFLRMGPKGEYVHDLDVIAEQGPTPTAIDIVFLTENPLDQAFQWWSAAELKCSGDGLNAKRRLSLAKGKEEEALAKAAQAAGDKFFPIVNGCYTQNCQYARGDKPQCKPHSRLYFQLVKSPRIGSTCTYDTTGYRSSAQLFSCIRQVKALTGRGNPDKGYIAGITLSLVLRPYKATHNGQSSVQYGVSLEATGPNAVQLARMVHEQSNEYRKALEAAPASPPAAAPELPEIQAGETPEADEDANAPALAAEFYGDFPQDTTWEDEEPAPPPPTPIRQPRRRSEAKTEDLNIGAVVTADEKWKADLLVMDLLFNAWKWAPTTKAAAISVAKRRVLTAEDFRSIGGGVLPKLDEQDVVAFLSLYFHTPAAVQILGWDGSASDHVYRAVQALGKQPNEATESELADAIASCNPDAGARPEEDVPDALFDTGAAPNNYPD